MWRVASPNTLSRPFFSTAIRRPGIVVFIMNQQIICRNFRPYAAVASCFLIATLPASASIQSTFDQGNEGWTQMDLDGDIRYVAATLPAEPGSCELTPPVSSGILWFRDPDAGEWVFEAPSKFHGNQSAMFGGTIRWSQHHKGCDLGDPPVPGFRVVLMDTNKAIAIVMALTPPPYDQWVSNSVRLDYQAGWAWVDDTTGQEDLPAATGAQIQEVLQSVTGFRIVGEFITGEDVGSLDNVVFSIFRLHKP